MIAADSAGHAGCHADDGDRIARRPREGLQNDRDQDSEGSPAGSGRKTQSAADQEDDRRQEHLQSLGGILDQACHIQVSAKVGCDAVQAPCEDQDHDRGNHGLKAFRNAAHRLTEGEGLARHIVDDGKQQSECRSEHQAYGCVRFGERGNEVRSAEESAGVDHADHTAGHKYQDRKHQIQDPALSFRNIVFDALIRVRAGEQIALLRIFLVSGHRTEFDILGCQRQHHDDGEQCVEIVRDRADEQCQSASVLYETGDRGCPG